MTTEHLTGRVKWFNNKAGYGFVTVIDDGARLNQDVFVHHSVIKVDDPQYKYLVQGEYIEFDLSKTESSEKHEWQATTVSGIRGGKLMCETRREAKLGRVTTDEAKASVEEVVASVEEVVASEPVPVPVPRQKNAPAKPRAKKESTEPKKPRAPRKKAPSAADKWKKTE